MFSVATATCFLFALVILIQSLLLSDEVAKINLIRVTVRIQQLCGARDVHSVSMHRAAYRSLVNIAKVVQLMTK